MIAKTEAAGATTLLPEVLAFSSSLSLDRGLLKEDLLGSLAHVTMLARQKIVPLADARAIHAELRKCWPDASGSALTLEGEEDIHMAVEAHLESVLGEAAGVLHTARSRNDQIALDLRLHVREQTLLIVGDLCEFLSELLARAEIEGDLLLPAYTHRQRAQPITLGYWLLSFAAMLLRDLETFQFVRKQVDVMPLGVGAVSGTSLPIDRDCMRQLLGFSRLTDNGLDTVADRDFALDYLFAAAKFFTHTSRFATEVIDFASSEFGFIALDGEIACGSSMMPHKRNPDVFELLRGKSGQALGQLMQLFTTLKGLPLGYNRDLQEDRAPILNTAPLVRNAIAMLRLALPRLKFRKAVMARALKSDYTQATDLAEVLVKRGVPFRTAYKKVGKLVAACQAAQLPLARVTVSFAQPIDACFDEAVLAEIELGACAARKESPGGTGPESVRTQIAAFSARVQRTVDELDDSNRLDRLFQKLETMAETMGRC